MNKKLKMSLITLGAVTVISGTFVLGTQAATTSWKDKAITKATQDIFIAGESKKNTLAADVDAMIETKMLEAADVKIKAKEDLVKQELEAYFNQKVQGLSNPTEVNQLNADLDIITAGVLQRFKSDIDKLFAGK